MQQEKLTTPSVRRFRLIANIEGWSYILLVFVAMPLKYWANLPMAVSIVGMVHGILFLAFCLSLAEMFFRYRWSVIKATAVFISSLLPFGTFIMDRILYKSKTSVS